jgi:peptidyl-tRNA hydrolase
MIVVNREIELMFGSVQVAKHTSQRSRNGQVAVVQPNGLGVHD